MLHCVKTSGEGFEGGGVMNCLFEVRTKATKKITPVYDVKRGQFVEFLVYYGTKFLYLNAQMFEPIEKGGEG